MPKPLVSLTVPQIGTLGLNKQGADAQLPVGWATDATNLVFNNSGLLESRKGFSLEDSGNISALSEPFTRLHYYQDDAGDSAIVIMTSTEVHTWRNSIMTQVAGPLTTSKLNAVTLNGKCIIQSDQVSPIELTSASDTSATAISGSGWQTTNVTASAYGYYWMTDSAGQTLYRGGTVLSADYASAVTAASLKEFWPNGSDEAVAIVPWNDLLLVFGQNSILIYREITLGSGWTPSNIALYDAINSVGLADARSLADTSQGLWFVSYDGVKIIGRVNQEGQSIPIMDANQSINQYIQEFSIGGTPSFAATYSPIDNLYILSIKKKFSDVPNIIVFDTNIREGGYFRATEWEYSNIDSDDSPYDLAYDYANRVVYFVCDTDKLYSYGGYNDNSTDTYTITYKGAWNDFGEEVSSYQKILKNIDGRISGDDNDAVTVYWYVDFDDSTEYTFSTTLNNGLFKAPLKSSGEVLKVGFSATIDGSKKVLKRYKVDTKIGRL